MGYFKLENSVLYKKPYPFDFHSHFNGILPLENKLKWNHNDITIHIEEKIVTIARHDDLSILGLLGGKSDDKESIRKAHYKLFRNVLALVMKENPFAPADMNDYRRGECAAENIYIACCILQHILRNGTSYDLGEPGIYQATKELLTDDSLQNDKAYHVIAYFNKKLFAANKYTPFDDAYWVRSAITDDENHKDKFNVMSLCYMYASGVRYAQIALSGKSVEGINSLLEKLQGNFTNSSYKLLVQSADVYSNSDKFKKELYNKILGLFRLSDDGNPKFKNLVGIDLLASEVKTGLYGDFFWFLLKNKKDVFKKYVGDGKPSKKAIMHIHCGEGGGNSENNRSLRGYYLRNALHFNMNEFSAALSEYAIRCYDRNVARKNARERERENIGGKTPREYIEVTTLFDELFHWNNLVIGNLQLCRFDINSPVSRAQTAYNGKTNIIHLCDTLGNDTSPPLEGGKSYYELLCKGSDTPFSFRIGHVYYNRNYLTSRFPALYYDTNLGSNFITGASGIFDSVQLYKLNRGLRHLDGHIDTNLIEEVLNSVACIGKDRLNSKQILAIKEIVKGKTKTQEPLKVEEKAKRLLDVIDCDSVKIKGKIEEFLKSQIQEYNKETLSNESKYEIYYSILSVALNWRSYLLGADGQGVEHSDVEAEAIRMVFMLAYGMCNGLESISVGWLNNFAILIHSVSGAYWKETIGQTCVFPENDVYKVDRFQGFKSPNSVVLVKASRIPS